jgi:hypothetical protein
VKRKGGIEASPLEIADELGQEAPGDLLGSQRFLEEEEGRDGLSMDVLGFEDGDDLLGQGLELARAVLVCVEERQIQGHEGRIVADPQAQEAVADGAVGRLGDLGLSRGAGQVALQPEAPELGPGIGEPTVEIETPFVDCAGPLEIPRLAVEEGEVVARLPRRTPLRPVR